MRPRLVFRTHYQVDEPMYLGLIIETSTSPVRSDYSDRVAQKLSKEARQRGKELNVAAAGYALDLARGLGVLNDQNVWTPLGHLIALVAEPRAGQLDESRLTLSPSEQLLYFRAFIEGDGAAILHLARLLARHGSVPNDDGDWNQVAKDMFLEIFREYLELTTSPSDRVALRREIERIQRNGYRGKSGPHKMFVHLQAMYRIGLVKRTVSGSHRRYFAEEPDRVTALLRGVKNAVALEHVIGHGDWAEVAAAALLPDAQEEGVEGTDFEAHIRETYARVMATGIALCPIETLFDALQIDALLRGRLLRRETLVDALSELQKRRPKEIRLHVDRAGRPAFLKI